MGRGYLKRRGGSVESIERGEKVFNERISARKQFSSFTAEQ